MKIAVIGSSDSVRGFAALGLSVFGVDDAEEAARILRNLAESDTAVIYITEKLFSLCLPEINRYIDRPVPAIIPIPGTTGNSGIGIQNVRQSVERAVGSDIIFSNS